MIEILTVGLDDRVLGLRVRGAIGQSDLDRVTAALERKLEHHKPLRIYAEVQELGTISRNLSIRHGNYINQVAM
jgi:hypothetical protein